MAKIKKAIIPAAGLGTRFLPATIAQPKEMLIVVDKPVIQYVVEEAVASGIEDILIVTGRNKRAIEDHFDFPKDLEDRLIEKDNKEMLEKIEKVANIANLFFTRQRRQKGLADAIYQGKSFVGNEPFAVLLGDTLLDYPKEPDLKMMVKNYEKTGMIHIAAHYLKNKKDVTRFGIIDVLKDLKNGFLSVGDLVEKPSIQEAPSRYGIASRYIFNPNIFDYIEKTKPGKGGEIQITDAMRLLCKDEGMMAYKISGEWYDIGGASDYVKANINFSLKNKESRADIKKYLKNVFEESK